MQELKRTMSVEEMKIRSELEMDVERDLEEEIKDGIYHLALRLHRLYQHQKERNAKEMSDPEAQNQRGNKNKTLAEVNINIKMDGGTKIEIKEIKKEACDTSRPWTSRTENVHKTVPLDGKKFDWAKSLRSAPRPVALCKNSNSSIQNVTVNNARKHWSSSSGQRRENVGMENKLLELGWRE